MSDHEEVEGCLDQDLALVKEDRNRAWFYANRNTESLRRVLGAARAARGFFGGESVLDSMEVFEALDDAIRFCEMNNSRNPIDDRAAALRAPGQEKNK